MRPNEGDILTIDGIGVCAVVSTEDPSLITLRKPDGACLRVGDKALQVLIVNSNYREAQRNGE